MQYKLRCNDCDHVFIANSKNAYCPKYHQRDYRGTTFIEDVLDVAVDVATAYVMADVATDVLSGVAGLVGSLFD